MLLKPDSLSLLSPPSSSPPRPMQKSSGFLQLISSPPQPPATTSAQACNWGEGGTLAETSWVLCQCSGPFLPASVTEDLIRQFLEGLPGALSPQALPGSPQASSFWTKGSRRREAEKRLPPVSHSLPEEAVGLGITSPNPPRIVLPSPLGLGSV